MNVLSFLLLAAAPGAVSHPLYGPPPPARGDNGMTGGIFGIGGAMDISNFINKDGSFSWDSLSQLIPKASAPAPAPKASGKDQGWASLLGALGKAGQGASLAEVMGPIMGGQGAEAVTGAELTEEQWNHPGTGKYPAHFLTDPSLPEKTIYAPKTVPNDNVSMPVVIWGEGGCFQTGTFYQPFLTEIASHGYLVLANGPPVGGPPKTLADMSKLVTLGQNKISDLQNSIDWAKQGKGAKYGNIDVTRIAAGGQSCGGTEALSIAYKNDDVKLTFLVNSGILNPFGRPWLSEFKYPVGIFNGGPKDIAYQNGVDDYNAMPQHVPVVMANLDTGHGGTLFGLNGGKFGKAVVAFLQWNFRGDQTSKATILDPKAPQSLVSQNWNISAKNWPQ